MLTTGRLVRVVQAVGVAVTFEALRDAVSTGALEVTRVTGPQLCKKNDAILSFIHRQGERCHNEGAAYCYQQ